MKINDLSTLYENLKGRRQALGLTQPIAAKLLGVAKDTYIRYEKYGRSLSVYEMVRIDGGFRTLESIKKNKKTAIEYIGKNKPVDKSVDNSGKTCV